MEAIDVATALTTLRNLRRSSDLLVTVWRSSRSTENKGLTLMELAPESSLELVKEKTGCAFADNQK